MLEVLDRLAHYQPDMQCIIKNNALQFLIEMQWKSAVQCTIKKNALNVVFYSNTFVNTSGFDSIMFTINKQNDIIM